MDYVLAQAAKHNLKVILSLSTCAPALLATVYIYGSYISYSKFPIVPYRILSWLLPYRILSGKQP